MNSIIGISVEELTMIIEDATRRGYEKAREDAERAEWLNGLEEIIRFISPKGMTRQSFNQRRRAGEFGDAVVGTGRNAKARKSDLMNAMRAYQMSKY